MDYEGITIERLKHAAFKIKGSKTIYIDPFQIDDQDDKADLLLITHEHFDHCSPDDIAKVISPETIVITVADCQSKISGMEVKGVTLVEPGNKLNVMDMQIEAVPAYNTNKFRSPGLVFHQKEQGWVGFIITIDGKRIYHAGDTDIISEMDDINDIDVALLPVSGTYVMTAVEAVEATTIINPTLAIPMHYGAIVGTEGDAETFKQRAKCRVEVM